MTAPREARERPRGLVLVVDDRAETRDRYDRVLGAAGYRVIGADHVEQALAIADAIAFDLVVIDVGRPGLDGFGLAQRLHARGRRRPGLLAVTEHSPEDGSTDPLVFDAYLLTPCRPETLIAAVTDLLATRG